MSVNRRSWLVAIAAVALTAFGCGRLMPMVTCNGIRQVRMGMTATEVRSVLGEPADVNSGHENHSDTMSWDSTWRYERSFSSLWLHVSFFHDHVVLVYAGHRRAPDYKDGLFILSARETKESTEFAKYFCH
jgi:hypothetical protein